MSFPPANGNQSKTKTIPIVENATISTGSGGLKSSIQIKNAGIKPSPGIEKVNSAS